MPKFTTVARNFHFAGVKFLLVSEENIEFFVGMSPSPMQKKHNRLRCFYTEARRTSTPAKGRMFGSISETLIIQVECLFSTN